MRNDSLPKKFLAFFLSMKTGLFLVALIIFFSVIGTVLPQERTISGAGPLFRFLYYTLNFGDIYHSKGFSFLLFCLCLNIAVCSCSRLPSLWRSTVKVPDWPTGIPWQREYELTLSPDKTMDAARQALVRAGFRIKTISPDRIYARKGQLAPWGAFFVHLSILLIALGAFYGSMYGFRYDIRMIPGESIVIGTDEYPGSGRPFTVTLENFATERYANGQVSDWISSLAIRQDGQKSAEQQVKVNHPLAFQGVSFYQSSYSSVYQAIQETDGYTRSIRLQEKQPYLIDEQQEISIMPIKYLPDFDPQNPLVSRSGNPLNPYIIYLVYAGAHPLGMNAIAVGKPLSLPGTSMKIIFRSVHDASGLEVKYDPGLPLVFAGFILMSLAFFASLYPKKRIVYAKVEPCRDQTRLSVTMIGKSQLLDAELTQLCETITAVKDNISVRGSGCARF